VIPLEFRKDLSIEGLLAAVRRSFSRIKAKKSSRGIDWLDALMSGLAIFGIKYPSLLQFDTDVRTDEVIRLNLRHLYGVEKAPCDTHLRELLDELEPVQLRRAFKALFALLQRGKGLEGMAYMDDRYLVSIDGTGYFSSPRIHCEQCCEKHHQDGHVTYYHQMLGAALVHPEHAEVFPFAPEPILKQDGGSKNDCERNAAKRLLGDLKREHPHLKVIVVEDGLASNGPHIELLKSLDYRYILGAKEGDHAYLFEWVKTLPEKQKGHKVFHSKDGTEHRFCYANEVPLNDTAFETKVNFLEYWEIDTKGKQQHFSWVTDIEITPHNLMKLMRGARARWKIENETFNTLKNQGYHFEHNFGHGHKHLSTVFAYLMWLAFLIDQIQQHCCPLFKRAVERAQCKLYYWNHLRLLFLAYEVPSWETLYKGMAFGIRKPRLCPELDTT
jgi:hypothetical protein